MNFRSVKTKKERQKKGLVVGLVVLVFVLGFGGGILSLARRASSLGVPFWNMKSHGASIDFVFKDKRNLEAEVEQLTLENQRLTNELLLTPFYTSREDMFQTFEQKFTREYVTDASVLVRPNHTLYNSLVVGAGEKDGVRVGDIALGAGSVALGKVVDVFPSISHVELFTKNKVTSTLFHVGSNSFVEAEGRGGSFVTFTISREAPAEVGDILVFPHTTELLFGVVEKIDFEVTDPEKTVYARSALTIRQLPFVQIIRGYEEQF